MSTPTEPGTYSVAHDKTGEVRYAATVRRDCDGDLEAKIPQCSERWHFVAWLEMQGFHDWKPDPLGNPA